MKTSVFKYFALLVTLTLAGCSSVTENSNVAAGTGTTTASVIETTPAQDLTPPPELSATSGNEWLGGTAGRAMDKNDQTALSHALDKAPGKSTHWTNKLNGTDYTVVPTRKITINGNPYCREYHVTITSGSNTRERTGTACVGQDSNWQEVNNG